MATVLLFTDEPVIAEGLASILAGRAEFSLLAHCRSAEALRTQLAASQPDLVLVDITGGFSFAELKSLQEAAAPAKLVLWVHAISTELALQAVSLGVRGILRKSLAIENLVEYLNRINTGEVWFEKALTESIVSTPRYPLTPREGQLVSLLSGGLKNKEIATRMGISEGTVKVYLSRVFQKLGVKDRFELALYALKNLGSGEGALAYATPSGDRNPVAPKWQTPQSFFLERQQRVENGRAAAGNFRT